MSAKTLLARHVDESKLRTKQLSCAVKYTLILPFVFLWDCSTVVKNEVKNLLTVSLANLVVALILN